MSYLKKNFKGVKLIIVNIHIKSTQTKKNYL